MKAFLPLLAWLVLAPACSSKDPEPARDREQFCQDWAAAACSSETVSACQATAEGCRLAQQTFCQGLVPQTFSDERADACLSAVSAAYADADLNGDELATVLHLGSPCDAIVRGPQARGETCSENRDCDASNGFSCVRRGGSATGSCQVPEIVGAGQKCEALQQSCGDGFYCNGANCIAVKDVGESCTTNDECGSAARCGTNATCVARLAVGTACTQNEECTSNLCYMLGGSSVCVDRIRLSPAEPICENLR